MTVVKSGTRDRVLPTARKDYALSGRECDATSEERRERLTQIRAGSSGLTSSSLRAIQDETAPQAALM